ncbi:MAG: hypothetical protein WCP30_07210 [Mycobacteriaceae bacterium]
MERMVTTLRRYFEGWATVDPAVALGLFGTGVGLAVPEFPVTEQNRPLVRVA